MRHFSLVTTFTQAHLFLFVMCIKIEYLVFMQLQFLYKKAQDNTYTRELVVSTDEP